MNFKYFLIFLGVFLLTILCFLMGNDSSFNQPPPTTLANITKKSNSSGRLLPPETKIDFTKNYIATLHTTAGDITIKLMPLEAPAMTTNFIYLSKVGFYNNTIFHRVINKFMIQGGDPNGDGTGGPGYTLSDEPFEGEYARGVVAMANSGPNTNGSQFFIMHADRYDLPKSYIIFGKVVSGMDVVDKIASTPVEESPAGEKSRPINPTSITSVDVEQTL